MKKTKLSSVRDWGSKTIFLRGVLKQNSTKKQLTNQLGVSIIYTTVLGDTLISPRKMFLISTLYYAMNAQIDLMKLQFCTEIEMECFYIAQNINSRKLGKNYRRMQATKEEGMNRYKWQVCFFIDDIPEHVNFSTFRTIFLQGHSAFWMTLFTQLYR